MARDDDGARVGEQLGREVVGRCVVEVVRRLVEEEQRWSSDEQRGEVEPSALAAREVAQRPCTVEVGDCEAGEHPSEACVDVPHAGGLGRGERAVVASCRGRVPVGERGRRVLELVLEGTDVLDGLVEELPDGARVGGVGVLREQTAVGGELEGASVRLVEPRQETQEGRLAGAVLADEGEPLACGDVEIEAVEDVSVTEGAHEVARTGRGVEGVGHGSPAGCGAGRAGARSGRGRSCSHAAEARWTCGG